MIRALAIKELREIAWIVVIGLAAYAYVVGMIVSPTVARGFGLLPGFYTLMGEMTGYWSDRQFPFVQGNFNTHYWMISFVLVVALAFRQSLGESRGGTYCFLLHRPLARRTVFLTKTMVGVGLYWLIGAMPVLVLGFWAATPGTHPSPFEWSTTFTTWKIWASMPIAYLAAFLCGVRQARWLGSRLVPLAAIAVPLFLLAAPIPWWWFIGGMTLVAVTTLLVTSILWAGKTRDFA